MTVLFLFLKKDYIVLNVHVFPLTSFFTFPLFISSLHPPPFSFSLCVPLPPSLPPSLSLSLSLSLLSFRIAQLQRENGELKGQLKSFKKRVKDVDKLDSTAHTLRQELDQTQSSLQAEISMLQKQVSYR